MYSHLARVAACALALPLLIPGQTGDSFNSNQRILRIRQLGKKDASALRTLAPYLKDADRDVRVEAVKAIVKIDTTGSLDQLVDATRDHDPEIRIRATDGIVNAYLPGYVTRNSLSGYFTHGVRQVRQFFSSRNDQVVDSDLIIRPDVAKALADEINDGFSMDARTNAALAAGILRDRPAVQALIEALHSKENDMIFESLIALQKIQDPSAGPHVGFLARDLDDRIQPVALETIGVLRSLPSAPDVRYALTNARNIKIRRAALESLAMLGMADDRAIFQQYASYQDAELRAYALEGLGRIREPEDTPALQATFDEPNADWRIHLAAAFALVDEGKVDTQEFSPLAYLVETLNSNGRADVASAYLTELAKRANVRDGLVKLLPETTKSQKIALCSIFGSSRSEGSMPALNILQKDSDPDVSFAASRAIRILQARKPS